MKVITLFILFCLSQLNSFAIESELSKDCKEVSNYIYVNHRQQRFEDSFRPVLSLYIAYNGLGESKYKTYNYDFHRKINTTYSLFHGSLNTIYNLNFSERLNAYRQHLKEAEQLSPADDSKKYRVDQVYNRKGSYIKDPYFADYSYYYDNNFSSEKLAFKYLLSSSFCHMVIPYRYSCRSSLNDIVDYVNVRAFGTHQGIVTATLPNELKAVLGDSRYLKGLLTSLEILAAIDPSKTKGMTFHKVLERGFFYIPKAERSEYIWNVIGLYATRGASVINYGYLFINDKWLILPIMLMAEIANRIHYLNYMKKSGEKLFTFPEFQKNSCVFGKAYHFWMAARLAHKLKQDGYNSADAFSTAYLSGLMYNFFGSGVQERKLKNLVNDENSMLLKSLQQTLLFQTMGAYYGSTSNLGDKVNIDVDEIYKKMTENNKPIEEVYTSSWEVMKNLRPFLDATSAQVPYLMLLKKIIKDENIRLKHQNYIY